MRDVAEDHPSIERWGCLSYRLTSPMTHSFLLHVPVPPGSRGHYTALHLLRNALYDDNSDKWLRPTWDDQVPHRRVIGYDGLQGRVVHQEL